MNQNSSIIKQVPESRKLLVTCKCHTNKWADEDCEICEGTGVAPAEDADNEERTCLCVKTNRGDYEANN